MAASYGDIIPVISRAVDEDDDDDSSEIIKIPEPEICWQTTLIPEKTTDFVIAIGPAASVFVGTNFMSNDNTSEIGKISLESQKDCFIHQLREHPNVLLCMCNQRLQHEQAFTWTEQLMQQFKEVDVNVTVLNGAMAAEYKCNKAINDVKLPLVRALKTSHCKNDALCQYLDQPNTVSGVAAQIISYCQIYGLRCTLYQAFTDTIHLDSIQVNAFNFILKGNPFKQLQQFGGDNNRLKGLLEKESSENLLYL
ncbi:proteasome assembly chaperone 1-like [Tubulanus polymorphus]|uniref:proteasome assembly chaperone 1-like n=1 Tax=Tubulanus polymorphus TaxID=672921 RepID=UPI003DA542C9